MSFSGHLRTLGDDDLVALLRRRPDLASPSPVTLASLAARATSRVSLERALAGVDAAVLQAVEAVLALSAGRQTAPSGAGVQVDLDTAARADPAAAARADPARGGFGAPEVVAAIAGDSPGPADEALVRRALDEAIGLALVFPQAGGLHPSPGLTELYVPHPAGPVRAGRTHRQPARPPAPELPVRAPAVVAAESAAAADRIVRLVDHLVASWGGSPPAVLRGGGLPVRELRRLAQALDVDEPEAAFVAELAGSAGLAVDDGEERAAFAPTDEADAWLRGDLPTRWARLAAAWLPSERAPWLVGTRGDAGVALAALGPGLHRRWVPRVRAAVLDVLADLPPGAAPALDDVLAVLRWRTPRSTPPDGAVEATLTEAARLGVTGAGALAPAGRALVTSPAGAAAALAESLPPAVDEVLLQGDLTGIVPGRPSEALAALLERVARVESRGGAVTVRFTQESVRAALDQGSTADELLTSLAACARAGVPQPLEYLIRDTARRHGTLRAGLASSYLRADDPALLAGLPDDPRLAGLGLRLLAPTVLAARVPPVDLVAALRARGLAPVVEGPDGLVVHPPAAAHRTRTRPRRTEQAPDEGVRLAALVERLRRADIDTMTGTVTDEAAVGGGSGGRAATNRWVGGAQRTGGTPDPAAALLVLREAAAERSLVWVEVVGGRGVLERRLLRPVSVEGGRLRAVDPAREAELVVAVHRIAAAERAS